jgi:hypothetical protein
MLRITEQRSADRLVLKLEGRLCGDWVREVDACWRRAIDAGGAPIWVDLIDTWAVDEPGRALLGRMSREGVEFVTHGCLMRECVREMLKPRTNG